MRTALAEAFCRNILDERDRQVEKWGDQNHTWPEWLAIFQEELGEAIKVLNEDEHNPMDSHPPRHPPSGETWKRARHELVQAAAVIAAWVENEDIRRIHPGPLGPFSLGTPKA